RSGGTAAFGAPAVPPQTPPLVGPGRPSHDPYGASPTQPPLYRDTPTSGAHGVPPQPSGQYGAPSGQYGAPSGQYGAPSGQYGAPSGQYGTAGQGHPTNQHQAPTAHGAHTPPPTGRAAARQGGSGGGAGRRRLLVVVGGVAAVLAIGVGAVFVLRGGGGDEEKKKPAAKKSSTTETPRLTGKGGPFTQDIKGMKFAVPATWELMQVSDTEVCVLPSATPAALRTTCERAGLRIWVGKNSERKVDFKNQAGWTLGAKPTCVTRTGDAVEPTSKSDGKKYVDPGKGSLTFEYASYGVTCTSGDSFQPQLWWLPQSMISFSTAGLSREYDADLNKILASVSVAGYKKPA
ncbi:hypothetical protein ABZS54_27665, partial [Embleya sp. NPDC005575]